MLAKLLTPKSGMAAPASKTPSTPAIAIATPQRSSRNFEAEFYLANALDEVDAEKFKPSGKSRSPSFRTTPMLLEAMSAYYDEESVSADGYPQQDNSLLAADVAAIVDIDASSFVHHHAPNHSQRNSATSFSSSNENGEETSDNDEQSNNEDADDEQLSVSGSSMSGNSSFKEASIMEVGDTRGVSPLRTSSESTPHTASANHESISSQLDRVLRRRASVIAAGTSTAPKLRLISRMQSVDSRALLEQVAVGSIAPTVLTVDGRPGQGPSAASSDHNQPPSVSSTSQIDSEIPEVKSEEAHKEKAEINSCSASVCEINEESIAASTSAPLPGSGTAMHGLSPTSEFSTLRISPADNSKVNTAACVGTATHVNTSRQASSDASSQLHLCVPAEDLSALREEPDVMNASPAAIAGVKAPNTAPMPNNDTTCSEPVVAGKASNCDVPHEADALQRDAASLGAHIQPDAERPSLASRRARSKKADIKCKCLIQ